MVPLAEVSTQLTDRLRLDSAKTVTFKVSARAYLRTWEDLLQFTGMPPARIRSGDVQDWAEDLAARALDPTVLKGLE